MIFPKIRKLVPGFLNEISGENRLVSPVFLARARQRAQFDWCPGWESNPVALLKRRKLLILGVADYAKNAKSA